MLRNYFVVAFRSLLKNKSYVIVNALGVGIAFACCLTAYIVIAYNIEFDDFHSDSKVANIFKIHTHSRDTDGTIIKSNSAPMALPAIAVPEIAGIERFTRYMHENAYMRHGDKAFSEKISFADSTFFEMFDVPLLAGNHKAFKNKYNMLLSEDLAKKYFGNGEAVGKLLVINFSNEFEVEVIVGGVVKQVPVNNTFNFNAIMRIENFQDAHQVEVNDWANGTEPATFIELTSAKNATTITKQLDKYVKVRNEVVKDALIVDAYQLENFKAPFTTLEVNSANTTQRSPFAVLVMFSSLAAMILLVACFNLTNTTIAMTSKRLKEIGIRKTIGAFRRQIVSQFLIETIIMIALSLGVGLLMAQWIVPAFSAMMNVSFSLGDVNGLNLVVTVTGLVFFASLVAGIYPALLNSKFKPIALLKSSVKIKGTNLLTRTLVTLQFSLSVIVLIGGVIFIQNTEFLESLNFGYDKEMVITVNIQNEKEFHVMENAISSNPKVRDVAVSEHNVGQSSYESTVQVGMTDHTTQLAGIGQNYFETMGLKLREGRLLNLTNASDRNEAVIVNMAFIEKTGIKDPLDKIITVNQNKRRIIGVIENHIEDIFITDTPPSFVFYAGDSDNFKIMLVKADAKDLADTRTYLENTWKKLFPTRPFESQYQDDIVLSDARMLTGSFKRIFSFLTVLGALLSISGIFSLASLDVTRRTKEIGIRKALGATVTSVIRILNKEFVIILTLAAVIGSVTGFYLINALLNVFNMTHIDVGILPVVMCGVVIFCIGLLTTSITALKAAGMNPVDTLRND